MAQDREIKLLAFKQTGWAKVRIVSLPLVYEPEYRIVLVLDRESNDLRVLEGGTDIFQPFGEWAWKHRTNPCDEAKGVDWIVSKHPRQSSYPCGGETSRPTPIQPQELELLGSRWPAWMDLKRFGFNRGTQVLRRVVSMAKDPPEGMYDAVPQPPHPKCKACGRCCMLFVDQGDEGAMPSGIMSRREWFELFHDKRSKYGVDPLFDAHLIHEPGNERLKDEVRSKGLNPDSCPYLGTQGCIIPWENKPWRCKQYRCPEWRFGWI